MTAVKRKTASRTKTTTRHGTTRKRDTHVLTAPREPLTLSDGRVVEDRTKEAYDIFLNGVLVDLDIGFWTARNRNDADELGVKRDKIAEAVIGLGTKRLVPKEISDKWIQAVNSARYILRRASYLFPIAQASFVPVRALPRVEQDLQRCQQEFNKPVAWLAEHFDTIRDEWIDKQPEHVRAKMRAAFPSKAEVMSRFYFTWSAFTITLPKRVRAEAMNVQQAQQRVEAEEAAKERYAQELERRVQTFILDAVNTLRAKVVDVCSTIAEKIRRDEAVTNQSIGQLRRLVDHFREMNAFGDEDVEARLLLLKRDVLGERVDADTFDDDRARAALAQALDVVQHAAENVTDLGALSGMARRRIVV